MQTLGQYLSKLERDDMRNDAITEKTTEIYDTLLSPCGFVMDAQHNKIELSSFTADMKINDGSFSDFILKNENFKDLRSDLVQQYEKFCEKLATELVDGVSV